MWTKKCSKKPKFIYYLLESLRDGNLHLAIIAKAGQALDIFEIFLKGNGVAYRRPNAPRTLNPEINVGGLQVTLVPLGFEGSTTLLNGADLVVAINASFHAKDLQVLSL